MPERSGKRPDVNELAARIVDEAVSEEPRDDGKNPHAVALGRRGGAKGGPARAARMTAKERQESARKAAIARWSRVREGES
jgi:hypothetical protein